MAREPPYRTWWLVFNHVVIANRTVLVASLIRKNKEVFVQIPIMYNVFHIFL